MQTGQGLYGQTQSMGGGLQSQLMQTGRGVYGQAQSLGQGGWQQGQNAFQQGAGMAQGFQGGTRSFSKTTLHRLPSTNLNKNDLLRDIDFIVSCT